MAHDAILDALPLQPPNGLHSWAIDQYWDSHLGGDLCVFRRESILVEGPIYQTMTPDDWAAHDAATHRRWGARCECTACGSTFTAGWRKGPPRGVAGIVLALADDETLYPGWCDSAGDDRCIEIGETDEFPCPSCSSLVTLVRASTIRPSRTWQLLVCSVEVVAGCAALVFWLVTRQVDSDATSWADINPHMAVVLIGRSLVRYIYRDGDWAQACRVVDPFMVEYYSWPAAMSRQIGGYCWPEVPDLTGTSGEKTGLAEYMLTAGANAHPVQYLRLWQRSPNIENLVKSGWAELVVSYIQTELDHAIDYGQRPSCVDLPDIAFNNSRPADMLRMSRADWRAGQSWHWRYAMYSCWCDYLDSGGICPAAEFNAAARELTREALYRVVSMMADGWDGFDLRPLLRYLRKQLAAGHIDSLSAGVGLLIDYRRAVSDVQPLLGELLWPRDLFAAHERTCVACNALHSADMQRSFDIVRKHYAALEWTDGDLCILLPRSPAELTEEGRVLRHCVGGYAQRHCEGGDVIFFVRHRRRPERSYYTLDIDFAHGAPRRVQLHGYGNERHGECKQYRHSIPRKVTAFCDRWDREVLRPWYTAKIREQQAAAATRAKQIRRTAT